MAPLWWLLSAERAIGRPRTCLTVWAARMALVAKVLVGSAGLLRATASECGSLRAHGRHCCTVITATLLTLLALLAMGLAWILLHRVTSTALLLLLVLWLRSLGWHRSGRTLRLGRHRRSLGMVAGIHRLWPLGLGL